MELRFAPTHLRALTLWPEWAWAIHHLDKRVENRTWLVPKDEWFMLHAGKYVGGKPGAAATGIADMLYMAERAGWHGFEGVGGYRHKDGDVVARAPIATSALLGAFRITDRHLPGKGDLTGWRVPDQVGNVFEYRPLAAPVPCKGAQGLWRVPEEVRALLAWP